MVEGEQPVVKRKDTIGQPKIVFCLLRQPFKLPHHVIGKVADASGSKRRQVRRCRRFVPPQVLAQNIDHVAFTSLYSRALANRDLSSPRRDHLSWLRSQEGVAPNLLAPSTDSSRKAYFCFEAILRKAPTGVSRSALNVLATGTRVASRPSCKNVLKSGVIITFHAHYNCKECSNYTRLRKR